MGSSHSLEDKKNINSLSFFDCCREIPPTKSSKNALVKAEETKNNGMSHTFYAKQDGGLALAGTKDAMLSHTTQAFLYFMMANPGAPYPAILGEFQFMVLNRCE
jgi:hypothetical protein